MNCQSIKIDLFYNTDQSKDKPVNLNLEDKTQKSHWIFEKSVKLMFCAFSDGIDATKIKIKI